MEQSAREVAATILWNERNQPTITTTVDPEIELGDWFRVVLVSRREDETVVTLMRMSPPDPE